MSGGPQAQYSPGYYDDWSFYHPGEFQGYADAYGNQWRQAGGGWEEMKGSDWTQADPNQIFAAPSYDLTPYMPYLNKLDPNFIGLPGQDPNAQFVNSAQPIDWNNYALDKLFSDQYGWRGANMNPYGSPLTKDYARGIAQIMGLSPEDADRAALQFATQHLAQQGQMYDEATHPALIADGIMQILAAQKGISYPGMSYEDWAKYVNEGADYQSRLKEWDTRDWGRDPFGSGVATSLNAGGNVLESWREHPEQLALGINTPQEVDVANTIVGDQRYDENFNQWGQTSNENFADSARQGYDPQTTQFLESVARMIGLYYAQEGLSEGLEGLGVAGEAASGLASTGIGAVGSYSSGSDQEKYVSLLVAAALQYFISSGKVSDLTGVDKTLLETALGAVKGYLSGKNSDDPGLAAAIGAAAAAAKSKSGAAGGTAPAGTPSGDNYNTDPFAGNDQNKPTGPPDDPFSWNDPVPPPSNHNTDPYGTPPAGTGTGTGTSAAGGSSAPQDTPQPNPSTYTDPYPSGTDGGKTQPQNGQNNNNNGGPVPEGDFPSSSSESGQSDSGNSNFNFGNGNTQTYDAYGNPDPNGQYDIYGQPVSSGGGSGLWDYLKGAGGAGSDLLKFLGGGSGSGGGSGGSDGGGLMSLLGRVAPAALGAYASNKQSQQLGDLAGQYMALGAPSRLRYEASYMPGFSMAGDPGYADAMNQSAKATLHGLSMQGNPAGSPNAWAQTQQDLYAKTAYPALQDYRRTGAEAGGLARFASAAPQVATGAIQADANKYGAIGGGLADIFNPPQTLAQQLAAARSQGY